MLFSTPLMTTKRILLVVALIGCLLANSEGTSTMPVHVHLSLGANPDEMNVVWHTEANTASTVEFGTKHGHYTVKYTNPDGTKALTYGSGFMHHVTMKNLNADTVYYYRVGDAALGHWSAEFHFHSAPQGSEAAGDEVTFTALGDMGVFPKAAKVVESLSSLARDDDLDFAIHVGDMAYAFGNWTKWNSWFTRIESVAGYTPYMVCVGNRDEAEIVQERFYMPTDVAIDHDGDPVTPAEVNSKTKEKQNFYYSFDYNFVHVVALSIKDDFKPGSEQHRWLEKDLASAKMRMDANIIKWIIILGHTPLYSSSNGHTGGNKELKDSIESLLYKYNVSFGIWGDDHNYERSYPLYNGEPDVIPPVDPGTVSKFINPSKPIHLLVGTAGIGLDGWLSPENPPSWSAFRELTHGYVKFKCTRSLCKAKFIAIDDDGDTDVIDEFWVLKQPTFLTASHLFIWLLPLGAFFILLIKKNLVSLPSTSKRFL